MVEFMRSLDAELRDSGELLELNGLSGPSGSEPCAPRRMGSRSSARACAAAREDFLAGYWVVDVASPERAVEIATRISATPRPGRGAGQPAGRGPRNRRAAARRSDPLDAAGRQDGMNDSVTRLADVRSGSGPV